VSVWLKLILPAVVGVAALAGVVAYITSAERAKRDLDAAQDYITGTEDALDAQDTVPDDQPSIVDWLLRFQSD
jgi:hypothetical protein